MDRNIVQLYPSQMEICLSEDCKFDYDALNNVEIQTKLNNLFNKKIIELIKKCSKFYVSLDKNMNKVLHFQLLNKEEFLTNIGNDVIDLINSKYIKEGFKLKIVSLLEKGLLENKIKNINLYY